MFPLLWLTASPALAMPLANAPTLPVDASWSRPLRLVLDTTGEPSSAPSPSPSCCERSFLIPALEVPAFIIGLNLADRLFGKSYAYSGPGTFWEHLWHGPWEYDIDPLFANVVAHPYTGSIYFNFARSSGLSFWWGLFYAAVGSALWELGGETEPPSINDQLFTPLGGAILGEVLYRAYLLILPQGERAGVPRHLAAFLVDPAAALNGLLFDGRFRSPEIEERPPVSLLAQLGGGYVWVNNPLIAGGNFSGPAGGVQFELEYGRPAAPDFNTRIPFSYFRFDAALIGDRQAFRETWRMQGFLGGWRLDGGTFHGVIGAFCSYDDVSAGVFRVSDVTAGLGATGDVSLSQRLVLNGTLTLSGVLIGAVNTRVPPEKKGYHLGPGAAAALDLRLYAEDRAMLELTSTFHFVSGNSKFPGHDLVDYSRLTAFVRLGGPHAIATAVSLAGRVAKNSIGPSFSQGAIALTLNYAWIPDRLFEDHSARAGQP